MKQYETVFTYPVHECKVHPHVEHSGREVNPLREVGEQLVIETLHPVSVSTLQLMPYSDCWLWKQFNNQTNPAKVFSISVHIGSPQSTQQLLNCPRIGDSDLAGGVGVAMTWRWRVTVCVNSLPAILTTFSTIHIYVIYNVHLHTALYMHQCTIYIHCTW